MRYPPSHKHATRRRIVAAASAAFRERGVEGVGVDEVMRRAGLTHGGFYAHFRDKTELVAEACAEAFDEAVVNLDRIAAQPTAAKRARLLIDSYLSKHHRDNRGSGCLVVAVGADMARLSGPARSDYARGFERHIDRLGEAAAAIVRGDADVMIAGGAESTVTPLGIGAFAQMRALSTRNDAPEQASRPYEKDRDGFVLSEGGVVFVLEEYEQAVKRGAKIYAELRGYGATADAYHLSSLAPGAEGSARAMRAALKRAGLAPTEIDYVSAHATSTPGGDGEEAAAIATVFADNKANLHVSGVKSMIGHLLGGAGAMGAFAAVLAIRDGIVPPTINLTNLDPECAATGLNFTPNTAVRKPVRAALANSFGFGGTNASLVFSKV